MLLWVLPKKNQKKKPIHLLKGSDFAGTIIFELKAFITTNFMYLFNCDFCLIIIKALSVLTNQQLEFRHERYPNFIYILRLVYLSHVSIKFIYTFKPLPYFPSNQSLLWYLILRQGTYFTSLSNIRFLFFPYPNF